MNKEQFLSELESKLYGLPKNAVAEQIVFYSEMIDDIMEDGISEAEAIAKMGSADVIARQIKASSGFTDTPAGTKENKRRFGALEIVLLVLGSPLWLSLLIAVFAVALSLFAVLWSIVIALWAAFVSLGAGSVLGVAMCAITVMGGSLLSGLAMLSLSIFAAGLSIFMFFVSLYGTRVAIYITKASTSGIGKIFRKKEC